MKTGKEPLSKTHPKIAEEAEGWDPNSVTKGSTKSLLWKCKYNHLWNASPNARTNGRTGCPVCAGTKILPGFNDLATQFPELGAFADGWNPNSVSPGSHKPLTWKCNLGHKWVSSPAQQTNAKKRRTKDSRANGCPFCWGRKAWKGFNDLATTHPDLVEYLRDREVAYLVTKGSEQKLNWICPKGHQFVKSPSNIDGNEPGCPICHGTVVLPGFNDLESQHPKIAIEIVGVDPSKIARASGKVVSWKCEMGHTWKAKVSSRTIYQSKCPYCAGVRILKGFNDLKTLKPELSSEIIGSDPTKFGRASKIKVYWKCSRGHEYRAAISDRAIKGSGCPYCSGNQILVGFNDLKSTHPVVAEDAFGWDPQQVTAGSGKSKNWKCKFGHEWKATIQSRALHNTKCPSCAVSGFDPNLDGYLYLIEHFAWKMFQIGISNNPEKRIASHKRLGWTLMEVRGPMKGELAQQWETAILRMLRGRGADLANEKIAGKFDGYSEAWSMNKFEVNSIHELMIQTEIYENR